MTVRVRIETGGRRGTSRPRLPLQSLPDQVVAYRRRPGLHPPRQGAQRGRGGRRISHEAGRCAAGGRSSGWRPDPGLIWTVGREKGDVLRGGRLRGGGREKLVAAGLQFAVAVGGRGAQYSVMAELRASTAEQIADDEHQDGNNSETDGYHRVQNQSLSVLCNITSPAGQPSPRPFRRHFKK